MGRLTLGAREGIPKWRSWSCRTWTMRTGACARVPTVVGGAGRQVGGAGWQVGGAAEAFLVSLSVVPRLPRWLSRNAGAAGSIPKSGRSSGVGNGNPLQYSCLENSMHRGDWRAAVHGVGKSHIRWSTHTGLLYQVHHLDDLYLFLYLFIFISLSLSLPHLQTGTSYPQALTFFQDLRVPLGCWLNLG